jgi:hypothetical protein
VSAVKVLTLSVLLSLLSIPSVACAASWNHAHSNGLKSIGLFISGLEDDAIKAGFTEEELKTAVEVKLRHHFIKLRDIHDVSDKEPSFIYLKLSVMYIEKNEHYIYCIDLCLIQPVCLPKDNEILIAKTWDQNHLDVAPPHAVRQVVMDTIDAFLDDFLYRYLGLDPRK